MARTLHQTLFAGPNQEIDGQAYIAMMGEMQNSFRRNDLEHFSVN
jgi:hypothetical protein